MARIAGINIPMNKHVVIGLTHIFGIGNSRAARICDANCSDYGHFDLVGNLRNERQRASE